MKTTFRRLFSLSSAFLLLAACTPSGDSGNGTGDEAETTIYDVRGVLMETKDEGKVAVIDHEEIPGYMRAMVMPFRAKNPAELEGLEPGSELEFEFHVQEFSSWIEGVKATGKKVDIADPEERPSGGAGASRLLEPGSELPDYEFATEDGEWVKLSDFRGSVVALTFIFTRCPMPEYCPLMMRKFKKVSDQLEASDGVPDNWRLLTISFDNLHDTPEVMAAYGKTYGQDQIEQWTMLTTDSCCTVNEIAANVGLKFGETETGSYQHNLRTVVLDPDGRITRIFTDETWEVEDLTTEMRRVLAMADS